MVWTCTLEAKMQLLVHNGSDCMQQLLMLQFMLAIAPHCVAQRLHKTDVSTAEGMGIHT